MLGSHSSGIGGAGKSPWGATHSSLSVELSAGDVVGVDDAKDSRDMTAPGIIGDKYMSLTGEGLCRSGERLRYMYCIRGTGIKIRVSVRMTMTMRMVGRNRGGGSSSRVGARGPKAQRT